MKTALAVFLLTATVLAVYRRAGELQFVNYDDPVYVSGNAQVLRGLTVEGMWWAVTTFHAANWHPVTWLSHMADVELFGPDAGWHHRVNVLIHVLNTLLLFFVLKDMTGEHWKSALVAALFAAHPLHVESVAWVAERKDLLFMLFFLLAMWSHARYARRPTTVRYLRTIFLFLLSLGSKPMAVTFPFVLLLIDFWPLGRFRRNGDAEPTPYPISWKTVGRLTAEKIPLLALSAASSILTFLVQERGGAMGSWDEIPPGARAGNALLSYVGYLAKTIWPASLSVFYPHPAQLGQAIPFWKAGLSALLLTCICWLAVRQAKRRPYLAFGWFWYLGTLVPVIGLVQVGSQAMADRYTYLPLVGLFILIVWGIGDAVPRTLSRWNAPGAVSAAVLAALTAVAGQQVGHWRSGESLFRHALEVNPGNPVAHNNLGESLAAEGRWDDSVPHYRTAIRLRPGYAMAHYNLGVAYAKTGKPDDAIREYLNALRQAPGFAFALDNLGELLMRQGKTAEAIDCFQRSLAIEVSNPVAHLNLGIAFLSSGRIAEAYYHYAAALQSNPELPEALFGVGWILEQRGRTAEAIGYYRKALRIRPGYGAVQSRLNALSGRRAP